MSSYAGQTIGTLTSAAGAIAKGKSTADTLNQQADIQLQNANQSRLAAKANSDRLVTMATRHLGAITTGYSASGVDLTSGSVAAVMGASAANAELDRQNILHGGEIRAVNFENQARLDQAGATHAIQASYWNAFTAMVAGGQGAFKGFGSGGGQGDAYTTDLSQADDVASGESVTTAGADDITTEAMA